MVESIPAYCDSCEHVCHETHWSEGHAECCQWERCSHCGNLLDNATLEQIAAEEARREE